MQVVSGLKQVVDGVSELVNGVNPMTTQMTERNQEAVIALLDAGFNKKEIENLIDVSTVQYNEFIDIELKVRIRMGIKDKEAEPTAEKTKAA